MKIPGSFITAAKQVGEKVVKKAGDEFFKKSTPLSNGDKATNAVVGAVALGAVVKSSGNDNSSSGPIKNGDYTYYPGSSW